MENKTDMFFFCSTPIYHDRFAETKRYMDFKNPGSQAEEGTFIGLEAALAGQQPG
jgi:light-harvesting complex I chlorophyll a/b binding protein 5